MSHGFLQQTLQRLARAVVLLEVRRTQPDALLAGEYRERMRVDGTRALECIV